MLIVKVLIYKSFSIINKQKRHTFPRETRSTKEERYIYFFILKFNSFLYIFFSSPSCLLYHYTSSLTFPFLCSNESTPYKGFLFRLFNPNPFHITSKNKLLGFIKRRQNKWVLLKIKIGSVQRLSFLCFHIQ